MSYVLYHSCVWGAFLCFHVSHLMLLIHFGSTPTSRNIECPFRVLFNTVFWANGLVQGSYRLPILNIYLSYELCLSVPEWEWSGFEDDKIKATTHTRTPKRDYIGLFVSDQSCKDRPEPLSWRYMEGTKDIVFDDRVTTTTILLVQVECGFRHSANREGVVREGQMMWSGKQRLGKTSGGPQDVHRDSDGWLSLGSFWNRRSWKCKGANERILDPSKGKRDCKGKH